MGSTLSKDKLQDERLRKGERDELGDEWIHIGRTVAHAVGCTSQVVAE